MQAYQHTPGPLHVEQNAPDAFFLKDSEGKTVAEVIAMHPDHYPQIEANAKLFALAPELVDALETALSEGMQTRKGRDVVRFALDKVRRDYTKTELARPKWEVVEMHPAERNGDVKIYEGSKQIAHLRLADYEKNGEGYEEMMHDAKRIAAAQ